MKELTILLASEFKDYYASTYCKKALEKLGHRVIGFDVAKFPLIKRPAVNRLSRIFMNKKLLAAAKNTRPDIFFTINGKEILPSTVREINGISTSVNWWVDFPELYRDWENFLHLYDYSFYVSKNIRAFTKRGIKNIRALPPAVDSEFIMKNTGNPRRDMCFIGTMYPLRADFISALIGSGLDIEIFGPGWEKSAVQIKKHFSGKMVTNNDLFKTYNESKIGLNIHQNFGARGKNFGFNVRCFEIPASNCLQLVDFRQDMKELFRIGKEVVCYESAKDCAGYARYYIDNESERKKIARAGSRRVKKDHTYLQRMKAMLSAVRRGK